MYRYFTPEICEEAKNTAERWQKSHNGRQALNRPKGKPRSEEEQILMKYKGILCEIATTDYFLENGFSAEWTGKDDEGFVDVTIKLPIERKIRPITIQVKSTEHPNGRYFIPGLQWNKKPGFHADCGILVIMNYCTDPRKINVNLKMWISQEAFMKNKHDLDLSDRWEEPGIGVEQSQMQPFDTLINGLTRFVINDAK